VPGHAGLKKITKSVRGKHGQVRRSYWVRSQEATTGFASRHKKKLIGAAVVAATVAGLAYGNRKALTWAHQGAKQRLGEHLEKGGSRSLLEQFRAATRGAKGGWDLAARKGGPGTLRTNTAKAYHKHLGTEKARAKTAEFLVRTASTAAGHVVRSKVAMELAEHAGTLAGAALGMRGKGSTASRTGRSAVGAIIGNALARGAIKRARKRFGAEDDDE